MIIFHHKFYLVRGKSHARMVVGSANLTLGGLNNNIEAGMLLDFDMTDVADKAVIDGIEAQLTALPLEYPDNIVKVGAVSVLDEMLVSGRLVDEMAIPPPRPSLVDTSAVPASLAPAARAAGTGGRLERAPLAVPGVPGQFGGPPWPAARPAQPSRRCPAAP